MKIFLVWAFIGRVPKRGTQNSPMSAHPRQFYPGRLHELSEFAVVFSPGRRAQSNFTIKTSERGIPSVPIPNWESQSEVKRKNLPSGETLPRGWVLKKGEM